MSIRLGVTMTTATELLTRIVSQHGVGGVNMHSILFLVLAQ